MNKVKLFLSNFLIYGLGGVIGKLIPFIMLPIVTRIMPGTEYFGISDMATTIISLFSAIAVMGMYDAMYRMFFEKEDDINYKQEICSTTFLFTLITSLVISVIMIILKDYIAEFFFTNTEYAYLVYITAMATLIGATNSIISAPTRMQNKKGIFLIANIVSPIISYSVSIPLLLQGYYVIALPLAALISSLIMEITFYVLNHKWFSVLKFNKKHLRPLLIIALPLLPNLLIYWLFNSADKLMITNLLDMSYTGIYSVAAKIGGISQLIYIAFAGGWQFFAFSTMKEKNQVESNSKIFQYLGVVSFVGTVFIFALSEILFKLLFEDIYWSGFIAAPYLFAAPLLQMLFQVAINQLLVIKKTWPNLIILFVGVIVNIVLNFLLIPVLGVEGAAIATLSGYFVSDFICVVVLYKLKLMTMSKKFILSLLLFILYILCWRFLTLYDYVFNIILAILFASVHLFLYRKEIKIFLLLLRKKNET